MFAIVRIGAHQYKVSKGDRVIIDEINDLSKGSTLRLDAILLLVDDGYIEVGRPTVHDTHIEAVIGESYLGEKVTVRKFKSKVRYRKTIGFRPRLNSLYIKDIKYQTKKLKEKG